MITRLSHASVYVLDQSRARDFYVDTLGLEEKMRVPLGDEGYWLTVAPRDQEGLEITLMPIFEGGIFKKNQAENLANLVKAGTFGFGVFECTNIHATYEELKEKGVEFTKPPTVEFYGTEALFKDDSGNWFSLVERPAPE